MLNRNEVLAALRNVGDVPQCGKAPKGRTIYEDVHGDFFIDYASFAGGTDQEVPLAVIRELEAEGAIIRRHPDNPRIKMWNLAEKP